MLFTKFVKIRRIQKSSVLQYKKCLLVSQAKLLSQTYADVYCRYCKGYSVSCNALNSAESNAWRREYSRTE